MDISQHPGADSLELRLNGRLDATWAEHVSNTIEAAVRGGSHCIVLNFAGVNYISSLGIAVLMKHYKQLKAVNGNLSICAPSASTLKVLNAAKLTGFLIAEPTAAAHATTVARSFVRGPATYDVYLQSTATPFSCTAVGDPARLVAGGFSQADSRALTFPKGSFGLGLGAFGDGFDDCRDRYGEFLAVGGCAITLPTNDRSALPDYVVEQGVLVPRVETLYALSGAGDFPWMVRFDANPGGPGKVALSELLETAFEVAEGDLIAFVVLAEAAGLVGASLRRSPASSAVSLDLPDVREWVSFTTERTNERSLALLVGVAARSAPAQAAAFLRPMKSRTPLHAHVHAALFPYRPVQRGELALAQGISELMAGSHPQSVMHLIADSRPYEGVGESDLVRGACWIAALRTVTHQALA